MARWASVFVVGMIAWTGAGAGASAAAPARPTVAARTDRAVLRPVSPDVKTLVDQDDADGNGVISQNFTDDPSAGKDIYDSVGADDFKVPAGHTWTVRQVVVSGYYTGGPAQSVTVAFYANGDGRPGTQIYKRRVVGVGGGPGTVTFTLKVNVTLPAGRYWLSVQANMAYSLGGYWVWNTNLVQRGHVAAWKNPRDGYHTGCTSWDDMDACTDGGGAGPDFAFALAGTVS